MSNRVPIYARGAVHRLSALASPSSAAFAAFRVRPFRQVWASTFLAGVAFSASTVVFGWLALEVSGSPVAVGVVFALRLVPALVFGIPAGTLVDRRDRRQLLIAAGLITFAIQLALAGLSSTGDISLAPVIVAVVGLGTVDTVRGAATYAYAFDLVGPPRATNAITLTNLAHQLAAVVGGAASGVLLAYGGTAISFGFISIAALSSALLLMRGRLTSRRHLVHEFHPRLSQSLTLILRNRSVALVTLTVIIGEVLGFSTSALLPTFARDVLGVGEAGLGGLWAARAAGGVCALLLLARLGLGGRSGVVLVSLHICFGVLLIGFAASTNFAVSLLVIALVGAVAACLDPVGQSLLQRNVRDFDRGAAMGTWYFAIGFGPLGYIGIGVLAATVGGPPAVALAGALLATSGVALAAVRALSRLP